MKYLLIFLPFLLYANIDYQGPCGKYDYNISINSNDYFSATCINEKLYVMDDTPRRASYIRYLYYDYENQKLYVVDKNDKLIARHSLQNKYVTKYDIFSDYYSFFFAVAGFVVGSMVFYLIIRAFI